MILNQPPRRLGSVSLDPEGSDSRIQVPPYLVPTTKFPYLYSATLVGAVVNPATDPIAESHSSSAFQQQGASAALVQKQLTTLAAGLWELDCYLWGYSVTGTFIQTSMTLFSGVNSMLLLGPVFQTGNNVSVFRKVVVNLPSAGFVPMLTVSNTGVGEAHVVQCSIICSRLA